MEKITSFIRRFVREEDGAAASEYAVLVAVIIAAVALAVSYFDLGGIYNTVNTKVTDCVNGGTGSGTC